MSPDYTSPQRSQQALEQVLRESGNPAYDLPNLAAPGWFDPFEQFVRGIFEALGDALEAIFGTGIAKGVSAGFGWLFKLLLYALCFVAVVAAGLLAYRLLQRAAPHLGTRRRQLDRGKEQSAEGLQDEIEDALRENDLGRASRLLWQVFLLRSHVRLATTPGEFQALYPQRLSPSVKGTLYHLMYSSGATRGEFDLCRKLLAPQEASS